MTLLTRIRKLEQYAKPLVDVVAILNDARLRCAAGLPLPAATPMLATGRLADALRRARKRCGIP